MADTDLGTATIVYDHPEDGTVEQTVENEHIAYFQDHWLIRQEEDDAGNDIVRRIPKERVHYVDRSVEAFEDEIGTLRNQVESVADDIRSKVFGGGKRKQADDESTPVEIDVESDDADES
jgi:hypothetical protein